MRRALLALALLLLSGCSSAPDQPATRTDPADALRTGAQVESDIAETAEAIRARATEPDFVRVSAARILDLIRLAPHAERERVIRALVGERDAALAAADAAEKRAAEAGSKFHFAVRAALAFAGFAFGVATVGGAVLFAKLAPLLSWFGRDVLILTGALSGLCWFGSLAYGYAVAHLPWVIGIGAAVILAAAVLAYANLRHERMAERAKAV